MISTYAPAPVQNEASFATALGLVPSGGVNMLQRLKKRVEKPASGPDCSVPATGCDGTKWTVAGRCGADRKSVVVGRVTGVQTCALPILMSRLHDFDICARAGPERSELCHGLGAGPLRWRQYAPAIEKKGRKACLGARLLGTGHGMRRDKMDRGGQMRRRSEERRGRESDWSSDVCSSDLDEQAA